MNSRCQGWLGHRMKRGGRQGGGFTLIEVMMTMMLLVAALTALVSFYLGMARINEQSRNMSRAMNDARMVIEAIRDTSAGGLAAVTGTNWTAWAAANGLTTLPNQQVSVTIPNAGADPLQVNVQVSWLDRNHQRVANIDTFVTQR